MSRVLFNSLLKTGNSYPVRSLRRRITIKNPPYHNHHLPHNAGVVRRFHYTFRALLILESKTYANEAAAWFYKARNFANPNARGWGGGIQHSSSFLILVFLHRIIISDAPVRYTHVHTIQDLCERFTQWSGMAHGKTRQKF